MRTRNREVDVLEAEGAMGAEWDPAKRVWRVPKDRQAELRVLLAALGVKWPG